VLAWFIVNLPANLPLDEDKVHALTQTAINELGIKGKAFYTPLRLALIGQAHGPDLPTTFSILGDCEALARLTKYYTA
jgi:glutamyl/glutaminyl-tRNA synthetase